MEDIKFRSWLKNEKKMIYGKEATTNAYFTDTFRYRKDEIILMQYTGLCDGTANKTRIYEKDIVSFTYKGKTFVGRVEFKAGSFVLICGESSEDYVVMSDIAKFDGEHYWIEGFVMGNYFESAWRI